MINENKWKYFQKRLELTWDLYLEFLKKINQESWKIRQAISVSNNKQDQKQNLEDLNEVDVHYKNTLYGSMLIMFCSLTEHLIKEIAKEIVKEYENKIKKEKGDWLIKNLNLIKKTKNLGVDENEIRLLSCYIKIRNCVVHDGGIISNSKNPEELKTAIEEIQEYSKRGNYNLLELTNDGCLLLGDNLVSEVVVKSEELIEKILEIV
jgi:uncharacterized protein YutE (UPF0331/DUF86 family)